MPYSLEKTNPTTYSMEITVEKDILEGKINKISNQIRKNAKVPGFRPGKAPVAVIKRYYQDTIRDELVREIIPEELSKALEENKLKITSEPVLKDLSFSIPESTFKCELIFEVKPEIKLTPEMYKGKTVEKTVRKVTDEDVQKALEAIKNQNAILKDVDREARSGDVVEIEYTTTIDGKEQKGKTTSVLGQNQLWPEVEKAVLGRKKGEEGSISFLAPNDEKVYGAAAGKNITVKFKVDAVKEKELPELNDEFAKKLGSSSLDELKQKVRNELEKAELNREQEEVEDKIIDELLKVVNPPVPQSMLNLEIKAQAQNQLTRLAQFGVDIKQVNPENLIEMTKPVAEKTAKVKLLLEKAAELENIKVEDEDLDKEIEKLANMAFNGDYVAARKSLEEKRLIPMIKQDILRQKALDRLVSLANIKEVEQSATKNAPANK